MSLPLPLYRFLVGTGRNRLVGSKGVIGEVEALCFVDAILAAEAKFAAVDTYFEVLDVGMYRQEGKRWVPSEDCPETLADAWYYANGYGNGEEVDGVPLS
jgi:hypothetical protein